MLEPHEGAAQPGAQQVLAVQHLDCDPALQDLVVALRAFPPNGRGTPLIGCSIDPTQQGLAAMQSFLRQIGSYAHPADVARRQVAVALARGRQQVLDQRDRMVDVGLGAVDANLAAASNAVIIGFNVRADAAAYLDLAQYEAWTPLKTGSSLGAPEIDRDATTAEPANTAAPDRAEALKDRLLEPAPPIVDWSRAPLYALFLTVLPAAAGMLVVTARPRTSTPTTSASPRRWWRPMAANSFSSISRLWNTEKSRPFSDKNMV